MSQFWNYRQAGISIASQLELPEWTPFASAPVARPDLQFQLGAPAPPSDDLRFRVEDDACEFTIQGIARYRVIGGARVEVTPAPRAGEREIRLFLLGSAWGIANYQRHNFPLHAGVVRVAGSSHAEGEGANEAGCIAFCGASGAGKSSSVARLLQSGYELWSDDLSICALEGAPAVWPSTRRLKLWRASLDALGRSADDLERDYMRQEKFHWQISSPPDLSRTPPLPLRAVYLLEWGAPSCVRLRGTEALRAFVEAATYRGSILNDMGAAASYWEQCAHIARNVPIWRLSRPRDWTQLSAALRPVLEYWKP